MRGLESEQEVMSWLLGGRSFPFLIPSSLGGDGPVGLWAFIYHLLREEAESEATGGD